jgi:hypothetical protein
VALALDKNSKTYFANFKIKVFANQGITDNEVVLFDKKDMFTLKCSFYKEEFHSSLFERFKEHLFFNIKLNLFYIDGN